MSTHSLHGLTGDRLAPRTAPNPGQPCSLLVSRGTDRGLPGKTVRTYIHAAPRCRRPLTPQRERDSSAGQATPPRVRHHGPHEVKSRHGRRRGGRGGRARGLHCTMPESTDVCLRVVFGGGGGGVLLGSGGGRCWKTDRRQGRR